MKIELFDMSFMLRCKKWSFIRDMSVTFSAVNFVNHLSSYHFQQLLRDNKVNFISFEMICFDSKCKVLSLPQNTSYAHHNKDKGSISPTFYSNILCMQIPKTQKKTDDLTVFFSLLGSALVKAMCKILVKST